MLFAICRVELGYSLKWFNIIASIHYGIQKLWGSTLQIDRSAPCQRAYSAYDQIPQDKGLFEEKKTLDNPGWWGDVQLFKSMAWDVLIIVFPSSYIVRDILCHIRYCTLGMVWCAWYGCPDRSNPLYIIRYIIYYIWYCALGKVWCAWYRMTQSSQKSRQSLFIGSCVIWQRDEAAEKF